MTGPSRSTDAIVGAFMLLGVASIVGGTLWTRQADLGRDEATVTARFRDVGSAGVGTGVFVRGVRAGRLTTLALDDDGWVRVRLHLDPEVRLPDDPVVVLGAASLFGDWQATVTPRAAVPDHSDVHRQLQEAAGERGVLPGATLPDVAQLTAVAGRIADDVGAVAGRVRVAFDDTAARQLRATIASTAALSSTLASTAQREARTVAQLSADLRAGVRALAASGAAVQRAAARADSATADGVLAAAVRDAAAASAELRATAAELRAAVRRTGDTQAALDRAIVRADSLVARAGSGPGTLGRLVNDPALYHDADSLVVELRALVADVRANPKRYVNVRIF
ncbi:MAG: MlaD family protein [Gemmatirosa sp.]